jgi:hypothetical protein
MLTIKANNTTFRLALQYKYRVFTSFTIDSFGTHGNSGDKSAIEHLFRNEKG